MTDTMLKFTKTFYEEGGPEIVTIEECEMEKKFKCKDEVLVRYNRVEKSEWAYGIFSHETKDYIVLCGDMVFNRYHINVIPFAGNEHLVGTTDEPEEEIIIKEGEYVFFAFELNLAAYEWEFGKLHLCRPDERFSIQVFSESGRMQYPKYIVHFSKFNPNDMESTKKEILTVRNGKLVKANLK